MTNVASYYENGCCPDCSDAIPSTMVDGGACENCGHVFTVNTDFDDEQKINVDKWLLVDIIATSFNTTEQTIMPNWCENKVRLNHSDIAMLERAKTAFENRAFLKEFIPIPDDLHNTDHACYPVGSTEWQDRQHKMMENVAKYGYADWYDFANAEWGTKWDVGGDDAEAELVDGVLHLDFDSAWSPPIEAYEKLAKMGFDIEAYFYEAGCAFCGIFVGNEEYTEFDEYGIEGDAAWVTRHIPSAIDEEFAISERMFEWEKEQAEEDL